MSEYYKKTWEKELEKHRKMTLDFQSRYQGALERIEQLVMDVSNLKVLNDKYREALEFYACSDSWNHNIKNPDGFEEYTSITDDDLGTKAREALKGGE